MTIICRRPSYRNLLVILAIFIFPACGCTADFTGGITWQVAIGFSPFEGLRDPESVSSKWMPDVDESFADWYQRLNATGIDESPYAEYLAGSNGPWLPINARSSNAGSFWSNDEALCSHECYRTGYVRPSHVSVYSNIQRFEATETCYWIEQESQVELAHGPCGEKVKFDAPVLRSRRAEEKGFRVCVAPRAQTPVCTEINVRQLVVTAFGDSYAAGEGNPDRPTKWPNRSVGSKTGAVDYSWLSHPLADADWTDSRCHRSFWSHQTFEAMRIAAQNPHRVVTYLNYSCSGAAVFDGILVPQFSPPGQKSPACNQPSDPSYRRNAGCRVSHSQISQAARDLCGAASLATTYQGNPLLRSYMSALQGNARLAWRELAREHPDSHLTDSYKFYLAKGWVGMGVGPEIENLDHLDLAACAEDAALRSDITFISIGGNDIGFGPLIRWALIPEHVKKGQRGAIETSLLNVLRRPQVVCPIAAAKNPSEAHHQRGCFRYDDILLEDLPASYSIMDDAFRTLLRITPDRLFATTYPDPLRLSSGNPSDVCANLEGDEVQHFNQWDAMHAVFPSLPGFNTKELPLNMTKAKTLTVLNTTLTHLQQALVKIGQQERLHLVNAQDAFVGHGWCAASSTALVDQESWLPSTPDRDWRNMSLTTGEQHLQCSHNPACWKAYEVSDRYVRTINDSAMTQWSARADQFSGALHPTPQGQAAIADRLQAAVDSAFQP